MARLYRVLLPVTDIESAADFFSKLFEVPGQRVSPGRHYFDCEGTVLACFDARADGEGRDASPNPEHIYLAVDDLAATFAACKSLGASFPRESPPGVGPMGEIAKRPWGEESFYVEDPFGNPLCFVSRDTIFVG